MTESVIIEFVSDTTQLQPGIDKLQSLNQVEKTAADQFKATSKVIADQGRVTKITAEEFKKSGLTLEQLAAKVKKSGTETLNLVGIEKQLKTELGKVTAEVKNSSEALLKQDKVLKDNTASSLALRSQLRAMIEQLAQMKVQGQDNTEQYRQLAQQAGKLKDAIGDANQEVKNFGSDTSTLDGVLSIAGGLAGGFAAVQGAAALFGDESEELQKTLLKVNAAMAILQGLQQIQVVLQKESAAATLINTIATKAQTAAQIAYNFVVGASTGLLKAFRIALALTGVGLLVIGLIKLVDVLKKADDGLETANAALESQKNIIEGLNDVIERRISLEEARARTAGASESKILAIQGRGLQSQREGLAQSTAYLTEQRDQLSRTSSGWFELNKQIEANNLAIQGLDNSILIKNEQFIKQLADEKAEREKKAADDAKQRAKEAEDRAKQQRSDAFEDFKAGVELQLLSVKKGTEEELKLRQKLSLASLQIELDNDKLTLNQKRLLIQQYFAERLKMERDFGKEQTKLFIENAIAESNTALQQLELSREDRLLATEFIIEQQAQLEIAAAEGNSIKIREIAAKRYAAIREARIASIQTTLDYELQTADVQNAANVRALNRELANEQTAFERKREIIEELARIEENQVDIRLAALQKQKDQGLITQEQYNLQYAQLTDEQLKIWEATEQKKTDITKSETEKRKAAIIKEIQDITEVASTVVSVLDSLYQLQGDSENQRLAEAKENLKALQDAGAITEKEAVIRQKRLEAEEKRIRNQQAQREKQIAVFNALLAIPQAYLKGLSQGGLPLAIIYGGLAAIQAAIIASRKIPKFGKGKKDKYQGLAEVGETGAELIQHDGKMYVANKPQVVWLSKDDKVYNPQETIEMMSKPAMNTERVAVSLPKQKGFTIDYKKLGKEVGKNVSQNIYVDGVQAQQIKNKQFTEYLDWRRFGK